MKANKPATTVFEDAGSERAVLAVIATCPDSIIDIEAQVCEDDFVTPHNKALFVVFKNLYVEESATSFDVTSVVTRANQLELLSKCGGFDYVDSLFRTRVSRNSAEVYLKNLVENSTKKHLFDALTEHRQEVLSNISGLGVKTASELLASADKAVTNVLVRSKVSDDAVNIGDGIFQFLDELENMEEEFAGLPTGFDILDKRIGGLAPGSLTILVARPKVGKSTFLMGMAKHLCYERNNPIGLLYIDTEMSRKEVRLRMLSSLSGVRERIIANGKYKENPDYKERVRKAAAIMETGGFYHKYMPGVSVDQVVSLSKKYYLNKGIGSVFFDYVKVTDTSNLNNVKEHQMMGVIASQLKDLAGELDIPVVTAAQIGRAGANTGFLKADMIADSDRLLRYCNNLLGLCRKSGEEIETARAQGPDAFNRFVKMDGLHRLQILETRGGGSLFEGFNVGSSLDTLSFWQADVQPAYVYAGYELGKDDFI